MALNHREGRGLVWNDLRIAFRIADEPMTDDEWRSGKVLPQRGHLELLAEELASMGKAGEWTILFDARLAAARDDLYRRTSPFLGGVELGSNSLEHFLEASHRVCRLFLPGMRRVLGTAPDARRTVLAVVVHGWRAEISRTTLAPLLATLGEAHQDGELIADLHHLVDEGLIAERALYWSKSAAVGGATAEEAAELIASYGGNPAALLDQWDELLPHLVAGSFRFSAFDTEPVAYKYSLPLPREVQAMHRSGPWNAAMSRGDYVGAVALARTSVADVPLVATHHFELGVSLGQLVRLGDLHLMDAAIAECRIAFELNPKHLYARNEVAVILSNAKLYSEALAEYAQAAAHCETLALFHSGRGWTLLALRRFEEAADAFEACLRIEPENVDAMARRAAILLELGRNAEARPLVREVRHLTRNQVDPERERARLLQVT